MNPWLQTKAYRCTDCGQPLLHDQAHHHAVFTCPARPMPNQKPVQIEKVYRPEAGR